MLFTRSLLDLRQLIGEGKGKSLWGQSWLENEEGEKLDYFDCTSPG